jgi:hypothetical protein
MNEPQRWADMKPSERHRDRLRHFPTMLGRWRGGRAKLWAYTVSHSVLTIRIERAGVRGNLHVSCGDLMRIHAPSGWDNVNIEIGLLDNGDECPPFVVRDLGGDVEIICGVAGIAENVKPVYEPSS